MNHDMTEGNPSKKILAFSLPLLAGNVFQQFYNMADTIIVGRLLGVDALAAVGLTGSITFLVLGLVMGACSGFAIPVAQDFGARNESSMRRCVANALLISLVLGLVITIATVLVTQDILRLISTPDNLMKDAYHYLVWIFSGILPLMLYNVLASILRALGDSRSPLIFLIVSSILNIVLDVILIAVIPLGVAGAAIATVISQLISGVACYIYMIKRYPSLRLHREDLHFHSSTVKRLLSIGLPMGFQFSITAIGAIILQRAVNSLGTDVVAATSVAGKVQNLIFAPMDSLGVAAANFAGQNYGAGQIKRIKQGVKHIFMMLLVFCAIGFVLNWKAGRYMALLFVDVSETSVIALVQTYLFRVSLFYPAAAIIYDFRNTLQGIGFSRSALFASLAELITRAVMGVYLVPLYAYDAVCLAHPLAWAAAALVLVPLYFFAMKKMKQDIVNAV